MNILHVISSGGMYGAEAVILNMSRIVNQGNDASRLAVFVNSGNPNLQLHEAALREGVESSLISCKGQVDVSVPKQIRELARRSATDIVHAHGYKADIYSWFGLLKTGVPVVSTCHTWFDNDAVVKLYGAADRLVLRNFDHVVAVSEDVRQRLTEAAVAHDRISLIRNGVPLEPFAAASPSLASLPGTGPLVGLVGRLSVEKGIDIFIEAAAIILQSFPAARFVIAGEGPSRKQLEGLIQEKSLTSAITLLGRRDDIPSLYASLDIVVSASRQEGLPIAILEAMASARPIVATAVGEVPSLIQDGRTGILVRPEDPRTLAAAVITLIESPATRQSLGAAAREHVRQDFSAESMTSAYMQMYRSVLESRRGRNTAGQHR